MPQQRRALATPLAFRRKAIVQRAHDARLTALELHRRYVEAHVIYERRLDGEHGGAGRSSS